MSFEFNGMLDSILPNIYINKITLEQKNFGTTVATNKHDNMSPHIEETPTSPLVQADLGIPGPPTLLPAYSGEEPSLRVIFDLFLEMPNIDSDDFWDVLFCDEMSEYLSINIFLFSGSEAKKYYRQLVEKVPLVATSQEPTMQNIKGFLGGALTPGEDYTHKEITSIFSELMAPGTFLGSTAENQGVANSQKLAYIKQKFTKTLSDGTVVHKIPIRMEMEIRSDEGAFPAELAAIAYSSLNINSVMEKTLKDAMASQADIDSMKENSFGRIVTEVIIRNGKVQDKGMMFYIAKDQSDDHADMSAKRDAAFGHLKGQLWFGSVHKYNNRFMSGNTHDEDHAHPYLDYVIVPSRRVQDFRLLPIIRKELMDYTPATNLIADSTSLDLRSNAAAKILDNPIIFSDLASSINPKGRVKLFFSVDWGRLIKKHCAIPALIDTLANDKAELQNLFGQKRPLSLKIYRERIDIPNKVVNQSDRKLVYDRYPKLFYYDEQLLSRGRGQGETQPNTDEPPTGAISALLSVALNNYNFQGFIKHYSFTDYDTKEITKGKFKYSIEIETIDPTLPWFIKKLGQLQETMLILKSYVTLAEGRYLEAENPQAQTMYNPYLGQFEPAFIEAAEDLGFLEGEINPEVKKAITTFQLITKSGDASIMSWEPEIKNMLDPAMATPDSIITAYEIFDMLTSQLKSFIEYFSITKIPKIDSGQFCCDEGGASFSGSPLLRSKTPVGASLPDNKIIATHTFGSPSEIVDTTRMEGGYHFFGNSPNVSNIDLGLKFIDQYEYKKLANLENSFFITPPEDTAPGAGEIVDIPFKLSTNKTIYTIPTSITATKGRFFTIQDGVNVILPNAIKSSDEENENSELVNNIIRYKYDLFGNPDKTSYLGYDELNKKVPNGATVDAKMERVLKQYQSLAYKGAIFSHQMIKKDPLISEGTFWASSNTQIPDLGSFPGSTEANNPLPASALSVQEILSTIALPNRVNWAANVGQERFLLALIMQHYFDLKSFDINLDTFNASNSNSPIGILLNKSVMRGPTQGAAEGLAPNWKQRAKATTDALPIQIKSLMMNWSRVGANSKASRIADQVNYFDPESGVFDTTSKQKSMFINKFGQFWFKHQNLVEIEYLSGHDTIKNNIAGGPEYESTFGRSSVGAPVWAPLTVSNLPKDSTSGVLLCRFKKYRHPLLNQRSYDVLDLPLYDEYFFLYLGPASDPQVLQTNEGGNLSKQIIQESDQADLTAPLSLGKHIFLQKLIS